MTAKGKCFYPNLRQHPNNTMFAKKKYFTFNFIHIVHKACQILSTFSNQCHCLHLQSVPSSSTHSLLTPPSSLLPFHNVPSSVSSTAVDTQHFLKPFTVTSGEMHCHAVVSHTDQIIRLYFLFIKVFEPIMKIHNFLHRWCQWY